MLNQPVTFSSGLTLKNRLIVAPVTTFASGKSGLAADAESRYYQLRNKDAGAIIVGSVYTSLEGKAYEYGLGASSDAHVPQLSRLAASIKQSGAKAIVQIYHGGAFSHFYHTGKAVPSVSRLAASRLNIPETDLSLLSDHEIEKIILDYCLAARRIIKAGFDGIEIHGSNSYLVKQFISPLWNDRSDKWGGSRTRRFYFLEILIKTLQQTIAKNSTSPFALGLRLSLEEGNNEVELSQSVTETLACLNYFDAFNLDYFHLIQGNKLKLIELANAEQIKQLVKQTPIILCGNLNDKTVLHQVISTTIPCVSACRPFVLQPNWGKKMLGSNSISAPIVELTESNRQKLEISPLLWQSIETSFDWYTSAIK